MGFHGSSAVKNLPANAEDIGLIPGLGRSPGGGNSNPLEYSCLKNSMDRGAWGDYISRGCKELDTSERLRTAQHIADSHCCTAGTNTTLYSNYTPIKKYFCIYKYKQNLCIIYFSITVQFGIKTTLSIIS